ncbi:uncharacterized protein LOC133779640 [Humulus lupulus]|uniref:uncharacterized protein LOC133779640 n=1 Tax=Humulus lupulus TaxID=3486 RepID=UPI002B40687A|nr:uncharacterized protein LOC133779640 [Humulus lupulus]
MKNGATKPKFELRQAAKERNTTIGHNATNEIGATQASATITTASPLESQGDKGAETFDMVSGQLPVANNSAYALMDTGAYHYSIAASYVDKIDRKSKPMENVCGVSLPSREDMMGSVNCKRRKVTFNPPGKEPFVFKGTAREKNFAIISTLKATKLLDDRCINYLANIIDKDRESKLQPTEVAVVCKFLEVFPKDLPRIPLDREVEFKIELIPDTAPISKEPYRMAPVELKELQAQLQDYLDKGFIRPSNSPWGVPVLFVKKKDDENLNRLPRTQ